MNRNLENELLNYLEENNPDHEPSLPPLPTIKKEKVSWAKENVEEG